MPRKKSATKKAKEAAKREASHSDVPAPIEQKKPKPTSKIEEESSDDIESESSEDEDDYGELVTEEVEDGINKVISAIRNNETDKLLDPEVKFFEDPEKAVAKLAKTEKHKPIYLKDYHRMNILSGNPIVDEDEDMPLQETVDGKQSYVSQEKEERTQLLDEIKNAFGNDEDKENNNSSENDDDDDGFLKKKEPSTVEGTTDDAKLQLPNPKDEEKFLDEFVSQQAWIPRKGDKVLNVDGGMDEIEDDDEFEDAVEKFENAYNFRYEDPNAAEIVSYARTQATLRRSATSARRRKRDDEKQVKQEVKKEKEQKVQKKKTKKVNQLTDILEQLKKEYGAEISESMVKKITDTLLNNDFKDDEWDKVVAELFNEEFYDQEAKPTWNDEDDEIMADFYDEQKQEADAKLEDDELLEEEERNDEDEPAKKKSKKNKSEDKKAKKKEKKKLSELVESAVEQNKLAILDEVEKEEEEKRGRLRSKDDQDLKFRYREVSPESFGLTAREIFAADDTDLNEFIGLKKFAPYRPKELRAKDKRKVTKSRRLRDWRKKVFNNEAGLVGDEKDILIPVEEKKSKHKHGHQHRQHEKKRHNKK
ncbi:hypothetical protein NCAS_0A10060 [Naumovozyma castellii]|uniref:Kri1-like C-terminal domain-containing protein n=1 Tax=Naumovozyma castellii TaxID=27288 RepID=G0V7W6_NAUCA|nr:hypothetical protein NCAS_0A10060 [Naumovozyma castellii CBS 4309]CCC67564.1 hypothetical protein NCAS_0A10060 [Naumovozyma castellii CBS 4309]